MNKEWIISLNTSCLFDAQWYAATYNVDISDSITHYITEGHQKLFDPSLNFSTSKYLHAYPDIVESGMPALVHYELYGKAEGRQAFKSSHQSSAVWKGKSKTGITRAAYCPESEWHKRTPASELTKQLAEYDVISFDVFDTLILRNVSKPTDVFRIIGAALYIPSFFQARISAEKYCYQNLSQHANIYDIYNKLSTMIKLGEKITPKTELEFEKKLCRANPYFKEIFDNLIAMGKRVIICSDMYLPACMMSELLTCCGYTGYSDLFVSCDEKCSKGDSSIQRKITEKLGNNLSFVHVGDNYISDIEGCINAGWNAIYYPSCKDKSNLFYSDEDKTIVSSIATSLSRNKFNSSDISFSKEYEHGYIYGGILVSGFCQWLNNLVKQNKIDQIWFLSRDMDIVHKAYNKFYRQVDNEYVLTSRVAVMQLMAASLPEEFLSFYFERKAYYGIPCSVYDAFVEAQLTPLTHYLSDYDLTPDEIISHDNYPKLSKLFYEHLSEVKAIFEPAVDSAKKYFSSILNGNKRIIIADLGWNGTILHRLKEFLVQHNFPIEKLIFTMFGSTGYPTTVNLIETGELMTYLYSHNKNCDLKLDETTPVGNAQMMCLEAMFSSDEPTLIKYSCDSDGNVEHIFGIKTSLDWQIKDIQSGMLDFVNDYTNITKDLGCKFEISAYDAFAPYLSIADDFAYLYLLFESVKEYAENSAASTDNSRLTTYGKIMQKRGLV